MKNLDWLEAGKWQKVGLMVGHGGTKEDRFGQMGKTSNDRYRMGWNRSMPLLVHLVI